nr:leukocyte surface antigen CD47-like [Dasypus novemcinctus]
MWALVAALLLGSACCGSAQLLFNETSFVEMTICNETVLLPCIVSNVETKDIRDIFVKWKFKGKDIFTFDGSLPKTTVSVDFTSAEITLSELLKGIASLKMSKSDAVVGNYTCEVTELSREGETIIELKYHFVSWFPPKENTLIVVFPLLAIFLSWGQFGILSLAYKSRHTNEKNIFLIFAGLVLTIIVIVGVILFRPGEYSVKNSSGLGLIVIPTVILILLQYCVFKTVFGMSSFATVILIIQLLGYILAVAGLSLCISNCTPTQGSLLIAGLGIIALAELLGLVYMKFEQ